MRRKTLAIALSLVWILNGSVLCIPADEAGTELRSLAKSADTEVTAPTPKISPRTATADSLPPTTKPAETGAIPSAAAPRVPSPPSAPPAAQSRREQDARDEQQSGPDKEVYSLKVNVDSVFLNVSVLDRRTNRSIANLGKQDFAVYEDGVVQRIEHFLTSEAPINLLLLLDVSGSTQSYLSLMQQASIDFIGRLKANDRVAIATFNSRPQLIEGFTSDRAAAERAIHRIISGGGTAFYDALMTSIDQYMRGVEGRSAIVVFTDGVDNQIFGDRMEGSRTTFDQLYRRVQEIDPLIYTIFLDTEGQYPTTGTRGGPTRPAGSTAGTVVDILGGILRGGRYPGSYPDLRQYPPPSPYPVPSPSPTPNPYPSPNPVPQPNPNPAPGRYPTPMPSPGGTTERAAYAVARDQLFTIAEQTGGRMYSPHRIDELSQVYSQIADDLRIQYQLGYSSTNRARDGSWRQIRVAIQSRPEAAVRTRKGYYARGGTAD